MRHTIIMICGAALLACACGPAAITKDSVQRMKREVKYAKHDVYTAKKSVKPMKEYINALKKGGVTEGYYLMVSPSDIKKKGAKAFIPYSFPAKEIHKKISGKFITKKILGVEILSSNRIKLTLLLKGKNIKIHEKSSFVKPHIPKIKAALHKGVKVTLHISMNISTKNSDIVARVRCKKVVLLKHNKDNYRNYLKKAINAKMKNKKYRLPLPNKGSMSPVALFTTAHHVIVQYK